MEDIRDRSSVLVLVMGTVALVDILARVLPDVLRLADAVVIPVGVLLGSKLVLGYDAIGWALGWTLLWTAVFVVVPGAFPQSIIKRANGLFARGGLATGAVLVGMYLEKAAGGVFRFDILLLTSDSLSEPTTPFPLPLSTYPVAIFVLAVLPWLTWRLPESPWIPRTRFLPYTGINFKDVGGIAVNERALEIEEDFGTGGILSRWFLLVILAGLVLSMVSSLFPLAELIFILLMGKDIYLRVAGVGAGLAVQTDLAERYVSSLGAIWVGPRGVLGVVYAVVPVFWVLFLDNFYLDGLKNSSEVVTSYIAPAFLVATLGVATLAVVITSARLTERLTAEFETASGGGEELPAEVPSELTDRLPRIPGFMLLPAALLVTYESVRSHPPGTRIYTLTVSMAELAVALGLAGLCLFTILKPQWIPFPQRGVRTYYAAPLSAGIFLAITAAYLYGGALVEGMTGAPSSAVLTVYAAYKLFVGVTGAFVGYELFQINRYTTTAYELYAEIKNQIIVVTVLLVGGFAIGVLDIELGVFASEAVFILSATLGWGLIFRLGMFLIYWGGVGVDWLLSNGS